jgi:hypothetical protein
MLTFSATGISVKKFVVVKDQDLRVHRTVKHLKVLKPGSGCDAFDLRRVHAMRMKILTPVNVNKWQRVVHPLCWGDTLRPVVLEFY